MPQTKYYFKRPGVKQDDSHWTEAADPDGTVRDKTQEMERKLEDLRDELEYFNALPGGSILDVGCGLGFFLAGLGKQWDKHGLDISPFACKHARQFGAIHEGPIDQHGFTPSLFDAIMCYHVIEHVENPEDFLRSINTLLRPGGKLVIATPDFGCAAARYYGMSFRMMKDKTHISLFTRHQLHDMLRDYGFKIENVRSPYFGTRHHTLENLAKLGPEVRTSACAPCPGNIVTFYAEKVSNWRSE